MNALLTINNARFGNNSSRTGNRPINVHPLITFATMNRVEVVVRTEEAQEVYRIEERDDQFLIYKYQRGFLGFSYFKKLAQARCKERALRIIHILTDGEIIQWEVSPVNYFVS